jgi:hypothetical protein
VMNNYLHDILKIDQLERGVVEFPRELPGLLLIFIVALMTGLCEIGILRIAMAAGLAGVVGLLWLGEMRYPAIAMIVLWSLGEHIMMPVRRSVALHMARPGMEGLAMGAAGSIDSAGGLIGNFLVPAVFFGLAALGWQAGAFGGYRVAFAVAGLMLAGGMFLAMRIPVKEVHLRRERLHFRRSFWKYYVLEMFFGARKQVFITFAPYVLIMYYGKDVKFMGILITVSALVNTGTAMALGWLLNRCGYRFVIVMDALVLTGVCLVYGFAHHILPMGMAVWLVCGMFILDAALFAVGMARTMYVKSISTSQEEVTAALSTGISINHLISIVIAIGGGVIWKLYGMEALFTMAAFFAWASLLFAYSLPRPGRT